jgi:hypothetical protein
MAKQPPTPASWKPSQPVAASPVRKTVVPKAAAAMPAAGPRAATPPAVRPTLTHDLIARRAQEIAASGQGGSDFDNWIRAERELRQELGV